MIIFKRWITCGRNRMEGYLQIWHGFFKRWEKSYFRIHEETLMFGPKKDQILGKIHLKIAQILTIVDDPVSFIIHTGTETLRLRAQSIEKRVIWFKKLKSIQRQVQQSNYIKQISLLDNKNNKIKNLEQITIQLWQCHADLQNVIDEISQRIKIPNVRVLFDKIRITVQQIKLKNSSALKIIEEYILESSRKKTVTNEFNDLYMSGKNSQIDNSIQSSPYNETKFMSFTQTKNPSKVFQKRKPKIGSNNSINSPLFKNFSNQGLDDYNFMTLEKRKNTYHEKNDRSKIRHILDSSEVENYSPYQNRLSKKQTIVAKNQAFFDLYQNLSKNQYRASLPEKFTPEEKFSFIQVFKGAGTDLTRFSFPVSMNQPISMLQKGCERMYYSKLLDQADDQITPELRMLYVTAFVVSQYSLSQNRFKKPSNPLWGQTFEFSDEERQFQFLSEQVSHHPPVSAMHVKSNKYQFIDDSRSKISFTGTSIKFISESKGRIILQTNNDQYVFNKCPSTISGIVMGKMNIEVSGKVEIICKQHNTKAIINFKESSFWSKENNCIDGKVYSGSEEVYHLNGKWNKYLAAIQSKTNKNLNLWETSHYVYKQYYNFNEYTIQLNHLNESLLNQIAPTDSRFRPDQRALEYRKLDLAASEKNRLQEKQRERRRISEETGEKHQVLWFNKEIDEQGNQFYLSNQKYWNERRKGTWEKCLDIY